MSIEECREQINEIDIKMVELIEKRMDAASQIGLEKARLNLPIFDENRETERLTTVGQMVKNDVYREHIVEIYRKLMDETKLVEKKIIDE